ncbi:acyltransferase [Mucilaginibacter sp. OK283]|uniref:acyltransferase family protein n=1 Tax=Mucilaginibacter sp. OK283 TaxID=1881049 RepID=UPI0008D0E615|nr:acyltransferase [Mucilaginibacter sp. OK283]SEP29570.1 Peptidoglycan/LPS O-acetylase OafA/YrhL, contains acyltransferase and SGNH-hydrolase domains [Mucilaginibacter sp. OK283]
MTKQQQSGYDHKLEGLRGLCALVVAISHFLTFDFFHSFQIPHYDFFVHLEFAHEAVLIFFVLSGYVIGLNHIYTPFNKINVIAYLKKRAVRLYPIYILAIIISFLVYKGGAFSVRQLLGHLFFMQEFFVSTISSNSALWSLSYEVTFYILFLALWKAGRYNVHWCLAISVLSVAFVLSNRDATILKSLLVGAIFWMLGLYIAQTKTTVIVATKKRWHSLISYFALLLAIHSFDTRNLIPHFVHLKLDFAFKVSFGDLVYLPVCFIIIMELTNRSVKYMNCIKLLAYSIPVFHLLLLLYFKHPLFSQINWIYGIFYFALAIITLPINFKIDFLGRLSKLGRISYALYVFHFPVLYFLNSCLTKYLSGVTLLIVGLSASVLIAGALSTIAELVIQPRIKKQLIGKG